MIFATVRFVKIRSGKARKGIIMELTALLTVGDALQRPAFSHAVIVAGRRGLHRKIRWVHILEVRNIESLLHGEEMILSTGIAFKSGVISPVTYLQKLIDHNASCLCIEIGEYFHQPPDEMIELADRHRFPLVLFQQPVRFVDITQDLHSMLINNHYRLIKELESVSRRLYRMTLSAQGTLNVLTLLHETTKAQIIYQTDLGQSIFVPRVGAQVREKLLEQYDAAKYRQMDLMREEEPPYLLERNDGYVLIHPVGAMGQTWGYITLVFDEQPQQFHKLLLDSASLAISQELLRSRYLEERKLYMENMWVDELLNERLRHDDQIKAAVGPVFKKWNELGMRVCLIEIEQPEQLKTADGDNNPDASYFNISMIARSVFEAHAFHPLFTVKNNRIAIIALDLKAAAPEKTRLAQALEMLHAKVKERLNGLRLLVGVGNVYTGLKMAVASYREAVNALSLHLCCKKDTIFFEDLGIFKLLLNLNDTKMLQSFVHGHLGALIRYDEAKNSNLLLTLKVFLECEGSKKAAARKLYIVRQSLYYRLEKIRELLGYEFMDTEHRITLIVALRAYQMLHPEAFENQND